MRERLYRFRERSPLHAGRHCLSGVRHGSFWKRHRPSVQRLGSFSKATSVEPTTTSPGLATPRSPCQTTHLARPTTSSVTTTTPGGLKTTQVVSPTTRVFCETTQVVDLNTRLFVAFCLFLPETTPARGGCARPACPQKSSSRFRCDAFMKGP